MSPTKLSLAPSAKIVSVKFGASETIRLTGCGTAMWRPISSITWSAEEPGADGAAWRAAIAGNHTTSKPIASAGILARSWKATLILPYPRTISPPLAHKSTTKKPHEKRVGLGSHTLSREECQPAASGVGILTY